ncbi:hypothetical protein ACFPJ1_08550 [Kribbella qitaiheensis]|uniref:hypothetical protein n=1 Tax=Kribbella qitaiheensis TaxID=1544730 RepID=UPI00361D7B72
MSQSGGDPAERPGEIVLSTAGETVTVTVAGTIDVRLVVALRKVLHEASSLAPDTLRLHLLVSVDGAELLARVVRETQSRFQASWRRFLVAASDPAVVRLLAGARIDAECKPGLSM